MLLLQITFTHIELIVQILYGSLSMLLILLGIDLLMRFFAADKRTRTDAAYMVFFIIAIGVIGYGIYMFPATYNYFYANSLGRVDWILALQIFLLPMMLVPVGYVCLQILVKNKKFVLALNIIGGLVILYTLVITIIEFFDSTIIAYGGMLTLPVYIVVGLYGLFDLFGIVFILAMKLRPQREIKKKVYLGLLGVAVAIIGEVIQLFGRNDILNENLNIFYVIGTIFEIAGILWLRFFFLSIPSYSEFEWKSGMIEMHVIIAETGISLYYRNFERKVTPEELKGDIRITATIPESEERPNTDLVAGGLVGIKGMLNEISGDRGKLENIQIGSKSLVFKQGNVALCLLLADRNLGVYHSMLEDLVREIEISHPNLDHFNGDTRQLHIKEPVERVFGF